jgi:hypothetical protein
MATLRLSQVNHLYHVESDLEYLKIEKKNIWVNLKSAKKNLGQI